MYFAALNPNFKLHTENSPAIPNFVETLCHYFWVVTFKDFTQGRQLVEVLKKSVKFSATNSLKTFVHLTIDSIVFHFKLLLFKVKISIDFLFRFFVSKFCSMYFHILKLPTSLPYKDCVQRLLLLEKKLFNIEFAAFK